MGRQATGTVCGTPHIVLFRVNQSINEPTNHSINQSVKQLTNQPIQQAIVVNLLTKKKNTNLCSPSIRRLLRRRGRGAITPYRRKKISKSPCSWHLWGGPMLVRQTCGKKPHLGMIFSCPRRGGVGVHSSALVCLWRREGISPYLSLAACSWGQLLLPINQSITENQSVKTNHSINQLINQSIMNA